MINNIKINITMSNNFQKVELEATVDNTSAEEINKVRSYLISEAKATLDQICQANPQPTTQQQRPRQNSPIRPNNYQPQQQRHYSGPSEKQRRILTNAGYTDEQIGTMNSKEISYAINQSLRQYYNQPAQEYNDIPFDMDINN